MVHSSFLYIFVLGSLPCVLLVFGNCNATREGSWKALAGILGSRPRVPREIGWLNGNMARCSGVWPPPRNGQLQQSVRTSPKLNLKNFLRFSGLWVVQLSPQFACIHTPGPSFVTEKCVTRYFCYVWNVFEYEFKISARPLPNSHCL